MKLIRLASFLGLFATVACVAEASASGAGEIDFSRPCVVSDDAPPPPRGEAPDMPNGRIQLGLMFSPWSQSLTIRGCGTKEAPLKVWVRLAPYTFLYLNVILPTEPDAPPIPAIPKR